MKRPEWKLTELAEECGVSPRTVRYYVQRGLLPAPVFKGRDTAYGEEHRERLLAIKRLQEKYLPLDAIEVELKRRSPEELSALVSGTADFPAPSAPLVPAAAPAPRSHPLPPSIERAHVEQTYERVELAHGLELHLSLDAEPEVRRLAEELRALARRTTGGGSR